MYGKHTGASVHAPIARSGAVGVPPTAVGRRRERFPHLRMGHSCMLQLNSNTQYIPLSVAIEMGRKQEPSACFTVAAAAAAAAAVTSGPTGQQGPRHTRLQ